MFIQKLNGFFKRYLPFANGYRKYLLISYNEIFQMKSNDFFTKTLKRFFYYILDPTNLIRVDIDKTYLEIVEEAFECFGEKIVAFHLKDFIIS
jgi:hypothetical protein